jgi:branched-subunit amino acid transport protein
VRPGLVLTFVAMGAATYLTRAPLLLALARRRLPGWLERYFAALPIALITALALPLVLLAPGDGTPGWVTDLPAAVVVAVVARRTGHLLVAVAGGVLLVAALRALLG